MVVFHKQGVPQAKRPLLDYRLSQECTLFNLILTSFGKWIVTLGEWN